MKLVTAIAAALVASAGSLGCEAGSQGDLDPGSRGSSGLATLRLALDGAAGVSAVLYDVRCAWGTEMEAIVSLEEEGLPHRLDAKQAGKAFADLYVVAPAGVCEVTAQALDEDLVPVIGCAPATTTADVVEGETTEVTLVIPCASSEAGALDVVTTIDVLPVIDELVVAPSTKVPPGEPVFITVIAHDEDDPIEDLETTFEVIPPSPDAVYELTVDTAGDEKAAQATLVVSTQGEYDIVVEVSDGWGVTTEIVALSVIEK